MSKPLTSLLVGSALLIAACSRNNAEPPVSSKGVTDPAFDWERPLAPGDSGYRNWLKVLTFSSTKSLEDTTRWLTWAIERYGHVKGSLYTSDVSDVHFDHCTMHWFERQVEHPNEREEGIRRESHFAMRLADLDLELRVPEASSDYIRLSLANETEIKRRYFDHGEDKGARPEHDRDILVPIENQDHICERIVWALVHAGSCCGAKVRTEFGK